MQWSPEAETEIRKVPFFVRKKVRQRVETEAREKGRPSVSLADVHATRNRFLKTMDEQIKGYQLETCFGAGGCPNRCVPEDSLVTRLEALFNREDLLTFLRSHVTTPLKFHHEFRVSVSFCPNACSQPQIRDIGIIGAQVPRVGPAECLNCFACTEACREHAIVLDPNGSGPTIDCSACLFCGACVRACPSRTIEPGPCGYRVLLGGRLGRHPRLARELSGLYSEDQVITLVSECLVYYKRESRGGQRFSALLDDTAFARFNTLIPEDERIWQGEVGRG
jgi:dissimilatory sulfite reductase (desulfoviridin) alpha/beta subunit